MVAKGTRVSGRKKGTPNKKTVEIAEILAELNCNPIEGMARIAMNPKNTPELRGRMFAELAQYIAPKRKAVEVSVRDPAKGDYTLEEVLSTYRRLSVGP